MQNNFFIFVRSSIFYMLFAALVLLVSVPLTLLLLFTPQAYRYKNKAIYFLLAVLYKGVAYLAPITFVVKKTSVPMPFPALYVANHQSAADIAALGFIQGTAPHFWFYWDRFASVPFFSFYIKRLGLGITQRNARQDATTVLRGISLLKSGECNALIFPEGGRFIDGKVHDFQCGFALLARKASVPVVPVCIQGMGSAYPPGSFLIYPHHITITIGEPLTLVADESDETFCARVHQWFDNCTRV